MQAAEEGALGCVARRGLHGLAGLGMVWRLEGFSSLMGGLGFLRGCLLAPFGTIYTQYIHRIYGPFPAGLGVLYYLI